MTAPLTPPDCDLTDFQRMMIDIPRLRGSSFDATLDDAAWRAGLNLWMSSWHQVPAASLEDSEAELAKAAGLGRDVKTWRKVKAEALRGWVKCDDGLLYHPTVAEFALEAWLERLNQALSSGAGNARRWGGEFDPAATEAEIERTAQMLADLNPKSKALVKLQRRKSRATSDGNADGIPDGTKKPSRRDAKNVPSGSLGKGKGKGIDSSVSDETGANAPPDPLDELRKLEIATGAWRLALKVLVDRGGYVEGRARSLVGKWAKALDDHEALWRIAEAAWDAGTLDPVSYVTAAIERHKAEDPDGGGFATGILQPSEARQRIWMEDWKAGADWKTGDRGPKPGEPGCRVSAEILAEFGFTQGRAA